MLPSIQTLLQGISDNNIKSLARAISLVENEADGYQDLLRELPQKDIPVIGFTGPPGAGKSTLVNSLLKHLGKQDLKIGVVLVDPSSPFNFGALLGDRIRLNEQIDCANIYIRSVATRGSLGGVSDKIIEILDVMRGFDFDYLFVETVGVGQSEVEIAGIADTTVVVLVPEAGDQVQAMKAGLMEVADIYAINKADRSEADALANHISQWMQFREFKDWKPPVLKTIAIKDEGIDTLFEQINKHHNLNLNVNRKNILLAEKTFRLIQKRKMAKIDKTQLLNLIAKESTSENFNLYQFVDRLA